jgi:hypothetical protein
LRSSLILTNLRCLEASTREPGRCRLRSSLERSFQRNKPVANAMDKPGTLRSSLNFPSSDVAGAVRGRVSLVVVAILTEAFVPALPSRQPRSRRTPQGCDPRWFLRTSAATTRPHSGAANAFAVAILRVVSRASVALQGTPGPGDPLDIAILAGSSRTSATSSDAHDNDRPSSLRSSLELFVPALRRPAGSDRAAGARLRSSPKLSFSAASQNPVYPSWAIRCDPRWSFRSSTAAVSFKLSRTYVLLRSSLRLSFQRCQVVVAVDADDVQLGSSLGTFVPALP